MPPAAGCPQARLGAPSHCPQTPAHLLRAVHSWTVGMVGRRVEHRPSGSQLTHTSPSPGPATLPRGGVVPDSGPRAGSRLPSPRPFLGHSSHEAPQSACLLPHPGTSLPTLTEGSPREGTRCQGHGTGGDTRLHSLAPGTCSGSQPRRGGSGQDHKRSLGREARAGGGLASTVTYKPLPTPQLPSSHLGPSAWPPALGRQRLQKQTQRGRRRPQALLGDAGEGAFLL